MEIITERFLLRPLIATDATERYLSWLTDSAIQQFIINAEQQKLSELASYIESKFNRADVLFLGIFDKQANLHIGNIKFEPLDTIKGYATMGMLIGDTSWRGKGVAGEVLNATGKWLLENRSVKQMLLGVSVANTPAIKAYQKVGFVITDTPYICFTEPGNIAMTWDIKCVFKKD
jgi:ribosomal-protein-alanine N-acetyltransferase